MKRLQAMTPRHNLMVWMSAESSYFVEKGLRDLTNTVVWGITGLVTLKWLRIDSEEGGEEDAQDRPGNQFLSPMGIVEEGDNLEDMRELLHTFESAIVESTAAEQERAEGTVGQNSENHTSIDTAYTKFGIPARLGEGKSQTFVRRAIGAEIRNPRTGKSKKVYCRNIEADCFADAIKIAARIKLRPVQSKKQSDSDTEQEQE